MAVRLTLEFERLVDYDWAWAYVFTGTLTEDGRPLAGKKIEPRVEPMTDEVYLPDISPTNEEGRFAYIPFFKKTAEGKTFRTWVRSPDYGLDSNAFTVVVGQPPTPTAPAPTPPEGWLPAAVWVGVPLALVVFMALRERGKR